MRAKHHVCIKFSRQMASALLFLLLRNNAKAPYIYIYIGTYIYKIMHEAALVTPRWQKSYCGNIWFIMWAKIFPRVLELLFRYVIPLLTTFLDFYRANITPGNLSAKLNYAIFCSFRAELFGEYFGLQRKKFNGGN